MPIIIVLIAAGGGFLLFQNIRTKSAPQSTSLPQATQTPTSSRQSNSSPTPSSDLCEVLTKGSSDLPPLYKNGITWQQAKIAEYDVPLAEGSNKMIGCSIKSSEIEFSSSSKARSFYTSEALSKGWNNISSSDLPGEAGSDTWSKNSKYFVFEILPLTKSNVQVTLFYSQ